MVEKRKLAENLNGTPGCGWLREYEWISYYSLQQILNAKSYKLYFKTKKVIKQWIDSFTESRNFSNDIQMFFPHRENDLIVHRALILQIDLYEVQN